MTRRALVGWSGFIGGHLTSRIDPEARFRSTDIGQLPGVQVDEIVCAGAPAAKWRANANPTEDWERLSHLMKALAGSSAPRCVLISTVDVFSDSIGADEDRPPDTEQDQAYGRHRAMLEEFIAHRFDQHLIVRLPGMFGPGLKKNLLFDLLRQPNARFANEDSTFQFYDVRDLWGHILVAQEAGLHVVNLPNAPVTSAGIAREAFGVDYECTDEPLTHYDLRTKHAFLLAGREGPYLRTRDEVVVGVRAWADSERASGASKR
ncbi:MAG: pyridine nucleotide transhydrogenase [Anaerolineaceae bacterium]